MERRTGGLKLLFCLFDFRGGMPATAETDRTYTFFLSFWNRVSPTLSIIPASKK